MKKKIFDILKNNAQLTIEYKLPVLFYSKFKKVTDEIYKEIRKNYRKKSEKRKNIICGN